jgi:hypothetical protein
LQNAPPYSIILLDPFGNVQVIKPGDPDWVDLYVRLGGA